MIIPRLRLKYLASEPLKYGANEAALIEDGTQPRFIRITDIGEDGNLRSDTFQSLPEDLAAPYLLEDGDILLARSGATVGKAFLYHGHLGKACHAGYLIRLRCATKMIVPKFMYYFTQGADYWQQINEAAIQATIQNVSAERFGEVTVPIPPIAVQHDIVSFLDCETVRIDGLIKAKEGVLALLNQKRRAITVQSVMRGVHEEAPRRESGITWLGEIPSRWRIERCAWCFHERDERGEPELPLLEVSINSGVTLRQFSSDQIESTASDFNSYKIARSGDLVFNKMRMWQGAVGIAPVDGLVSPDYTVASISSQLAPDYVSYLMRMEIFSAECARESHGITWDRLRLYWDGFRDIRIPLPPLQEQDEIVTSLRQKEAEIEALRAATRMTIDLLRERRAALISAAVAGHINIGDNDAR